MAQNIRYNGLPFLSIKFLSDRALVASGWDNNVSLFVDTGSHWCASWLAVALAARSMCTREPAPCLQGVQAAARQGGCRRQRGQD